MSAAKELWRGHHPDRQRLPRNFEDSLCLKFYRIQEGSVAIPIFREVEAVTQQELFEFNQPDELDQAVTLVTEAIIAVGSDQPLPDALPKNVLPLFDAYGRTLREDESFELQPYGSSRRASYTPRSRESLLKFCAEGYTDRIDLVGEVRVADLAGRFELRLDDGTRVPARFSPEQEALVTEALRDHASRRLRVRGTAEFHPDGKIKGIPAVPDLLIQPAGESPFDPTARPIWEEFAEIGASVPPEEWARLPRDLAKNHEHYLYGAATRE